MPVFFIFFCSSGVERGYSPSLKYENDYDLRGTASIKTLYADIYIKRIDNKSWRKLHEYPHYINKDTSESDFRVPPFISFFMIIKNNSDFPLVYSFSEIKSALEVQKDLSISDINSELKSPAYLFSNHEKLISFFRLIAEKRSLEEIDFENDLIPTTVDYIPPGDSVVKVVHFRWIPVSFREFTMSISLTVGGLKKVIDFDFRKFEYRTDGEYFLKPKRKDGDFD